MQSASLAFPLSAARRTAEDPVAGSSLAALRITLLRGETLRLPAWAGSLRVARGRAWVGSGREESILCRGQGFSILRFPRYPLLVTAIGEEELSLTIEPRPR